MAADDPEGEYRIVEVRRPDVECSIERHGDRFFVLTNEDAASADHLVTQPEVGL